MLKSSLTSSLRGWERKNFDHSRLVVKRALYEKNVAEFKFKFFTGFRKKPPNIDSFCVILFSEDKKFPAVVKRLSEEGRDVWTGCN